MLRRLPDALPLDGHVQEQPEVRETVRKTERPLRQPQVFGDGLRPTMERHRRPSGKLVHDWDGVLSHLAISCPARAESTSMPRW